MQKTIIFEHIPKTGGVTLRGILYKKYTEKKIFLINSHNPEISYNEFNSMNANQREPYSVIAGHGALMYRPLLQDAFTVTILRNPIVLFFSQYNYLRITERNRYWKDVRKMKNPEEYLEYAISMGQDNLMTRFLANSMQWTVDPDQKFQNMQDSGETLLHEAMQNLQSFDVVIDLSNFDAGVFALSRKLGWKSIPLYKPSNRTRKKPLRRNTDQKFMEKLRHALRFDIELYNFFHDQQLESALTINTGSPTYRLFRLRQQLAKNVAILLGKN